MARTFELACHTCKVSLWIGQRDSGASMEQAKIYNTPRHQQQQRDFLYAHIGHRLEFNDTDEFELLDYEDIDADEDHS